MTSPRYRLAADVGGTFTDVVLIDDAGNVWSHKVLSTPPDFERAVLEAAEQLLQMRGAAGADVEAVAHGTTVATNAVLEQRGARTALVTNEGFRDVLELRRIRAPQIYDLFFDKPPVLVERALRLELSCRVAADGEELRSLKEAELEQLAERLEEGAVESLAVCFLHAYAHAEHEVAVREFLRVRLPDLPVSLSSEVLPERREYERSATTVVNAYVQPVMRGYLDALGSGLKRLGIAAPLLIMQSAGGLVPEEEAARRPVFALESGPAAGVLAAAFTAEQLGLGDLITLDMGGTTAKASLIEEGRIAYSPQYEVGASLSFGSRLLGGGGELIRAPTIDIAEVGAGGGSIAWLDRAGGLRVGPRSAGAQPGPVCYQRGGSEPTLTDANVALGYIRPGALAGGEVTIDPEAARRAIYDVIARPLDLELLRAAEGVHQIANARTMRALRQVSTERGRDPRDFTLMAFGGSGPVHAAGLARELGVRRILVPPLPGLFSALGLLFSGIEHHDVRSLLLTGEQLGDLEPVRRDMAARMVERFAAEGFAAASVGLHFSADVRFRGQTSELRIDLEGGPVSLDSARALVDAFLEEHERHYGHRSDPGNPVEVVALRLVGRAGRRGRGKRLRPDRPPAETATSRQAFFSGTLIDTPVLPRSAITAATDGPLLIDEYDSTIVVPPDLRVHVDADGNLVMEAKGG